MSSSFSSSRSSFHCSSDSLLEVGIYLFPTFFVFFSGDWEGVFSPFFLGTLFLL